MKKHLSMAALVLATVCMIPTAHANLNQSGVSWHAMYAADASSINYRASGVENWSASSKPIIGAVNYAYNSGGISMYVDGTNYNGASTSVTVYSYDYNGYYLSGQSATLTGTYDRWFGLTTAQAPQWAFVSVYANLPPNANGLFRGVTSLY